MLSKPDAEKNSSECSSTRTTERWVVFWWILTISLTFTKTFEVSGFIMTFVELKEQNNSLAIYACFLRNVFAI